MIDTNMTRSQARGWLKRNWSDLKSSGRLDEALSSYFKRYISYEELNNFGENSKRNTKDPLDVFNNSLDLSDFGG